MLKDLTKADWLSILNLTEDRVPRALILRGTRNLRTRYGQHLANFDDAIEIGLPNGLFEDVFIGRHHGILVGYASVYGGAMASEITHVFGVLGTPLVIQTGVCGALGDGIEAGDLIVVTEAGCGEGAAHCYFPGRRSVSASPELVASLLTDAAGAAQTWSGPIWTTGALLAEGEAEINLWHRQGYIAVDMETASTFAVADYFGMRRLSVLSVFDNPREGAHLALNERQKHDARRQGEDAMQRLLFRTIEANP